MEEDENTWKRSVKIKRDIYGVANRVAPGGRTPGIDSETAKKMIRKDEDVEPVFYWCYPYQFHEDLARGLGPRLIVNLTVGDGAGALAALLLAKPFVGVCLTQEHRAGVRTHLANYVFRSFMTDGTPFYDARICQELQDAGVTKQAILEDTAAQSGGSAPASKAKAKSKSSAKAVPKAPAAPAGKAAPGKAAPPTKAAPPKATPEAKAKGMAKSVIADNMKKALAALSGADEEEGDEEAAGEEAEGEEGAADAE